MATTDIRHNGHRINRQFTKWLQALFDDIGYKTSLSFGFHTSADVVFQDDYEMPYPDGRILFTQFDRLPDEVIKKYDKIIYNTPIAALSHYHDWDKYKLGYKIFNGFYSGLRDKSKNRDYRFNDDDILIGLKGKYNIPKFKNMDDYYRFISLFRYTYFFKDKLYPSITLRVYEAYHLDICIKGDDYKIISKEELIKWFSNILQKI